MTSKEIILKYPEVFGVPPYDPKENLLCFGFEISDKWMYIMEEFAEKTSKYVKKEGLDDFSVVQVKEKFGSLRIYCNYQTDEISKYISEAEKAAESTCEECGRPGVRKRVDGWVRVICAECENN